MAKKKKAELAVEIVHYVLGMYVLIHNTVAVLNENTYLEYLKAGFSS